MDILCFLKITVHLHCNRIVKRIFNSWTGIYIRSIPFQSETIEILVIKIFVLALIFLLHVTVCCKYLGIVEFARYRFDISQSCSLVRKLGLFAPGTSETWRN